jgi:hypothetical protein
MGKEPVITEQKRRGRPPKEKKEGEAKMLRVIATPRQALLLGKIQKKFGMTDSEHLRRALDAYIKGFLDNKDIKE